MGKITVTYYYIHNPSETYTETYNNKWEEMEAADMAAADGWRVLNR